MLSFKGRHFPKDIILMGVRWYVAYSLSTRDIEALLLERGIKVDHATINRWVIQYSPLLEAPFRKQYKSSVGSSWRMDETYIKVKDTILIVKLFFIFFNIFTLNPNIEQRYALVHCFKKIACCSVDKLTR